jgi:ABC-type sugar transport system ATPase subunit
MGIDSIDPRQKVGRISLAERQLVEIAKVLTLRRPRILIFDEPTAALGPADVARLFRIMGELRDQGVAIIFVSHRYREVLAICDRATVLRNGRVVGDVECGRATVEHLVELTLGQKAETVFRRNWRAAEPGEPVLVVRDLEVGARVRGVDLELRRGEIVGVCGLLGSGQNELARALAGDLPDVSGTVAIDGRTTTVRHPRQAFRAGLALITENRQEEGLFPDMSVRSNISISSLARVLVTPFLRVISRRTERRVTRGVAERTGIASTLLSRRVKVLSGGNQQKSLLARWLMHRSDAFVLIEPTRGVDVGAKLEIYRRLEELAADGAGVLLISTDVPEVMGISDRIAVLYEGRVTEILHGEDATEQQLLLAIQGGVSTPTTPAGAAS